MLSAYALRGRLNSRVSQLSNAGSTVPGRFYCVILRTLVRCQAEIDKFRALQHIKPCMLTLLSWVVIY